MVFGMAAFSSKSMKSIESTKDDGTNSLATEKKLSALIVDDDPIIRRIHMVLLNKLGINTQVAENGKKAVDLFRYGVTFDLVIMNMEMPIMDGPGATKELRAMGIDSMIVGVTSRSLDSEKQAFVGAGLDDYYVKPLIADNITSLLHKLNKNH